MAQGGIRGTLTGNAASIPNPAVCSGSVSVSIGDLIVGICGQQTNLTVTACADNLGNTYTAQNAGTDPGSPTARVYYSVATVAGTLTAVNFTTTGSTNDWAGLAMVIEGPVGSIDANIANTTTDVTSPFTCPSSGTLASANEIVIGWGAANQSTVWAATSPNLLAGNTNNSTNVKVALGYQLVTATTAVSPAFTAGANPTTCILGTFTFRAPRLLTAAFAGDSTLTFFPEVQRRAAASFAGDSTLTFFPEVQRRAETTFAGEGSMVADATITTSATEHQGSSDFVGAGALNAVLTKVVADTTTFAGVGSMVADATFLAGEEQGSAAFEGVGALVAAASVRTTGTAVFAGTGALTSALAKIAADTTAFAGVGSFVADASVRSSVATAEADFAGAGSLTAFASVVMPASANFAGTGGLVFTVASDGVSWFTEQGAAGNLARNLRKLAVQGCRVQTSTDPVPAGGGCVASVRATSEVVAASSGAEVGGESDCGASQRGSAVSVCGYGAEAGAGFPGEVCSSSVSSFTGSGLRVGGGRVRAVASSVATFSSSHAVGGYQGTASARGVKNPTDEELLSIAMAMFQKAA
jgi:hypothetical protein